MNDMSNTTIISRASYICEDGVRDLQNSRVLEVKKSTIIAAVCPHIRNRAEIDEVIPGRHFNSTLRTNLSRKSEPRKQRKNKNIRHLHP
jgi:hypothetical protein